jgi:hypothetical protein
MLRINISNSCNTCSNILFYVLSFQCILNQLNQTFQSKHMIVLSEHTFETLIWSVSSSTTLLMMYLYNFVPFESEILTYSTLKFILGNVIGLIKIGCAKWNL